MSIGSHGLAKEWSPRLAGSPMSRLGKRKGSSGVSCSTLVGRGVRLRLLWTVALVATLAWCGVSLIHVPDVSTAPDVDETAAGCSRAWWTGQSRRSLMFQRESFPSSSSISSVSVSSNSSNKPSGAPGQADMWPQMEGYLPWEPLPRPALQGADERCEALFGHGYNATYHLFGSPLLLPMHQPQPLPAAMAEALRAAKVVARTGSATSKETEGESSGSHASHGGGGGGDAASGLLGESAGAGPAGLKAERGWLTCHHNGVTSIGVCEGSMLVMHPDRIRMSAGGERIADVMNRAESDELPQFAPGAFEVPGGGVRGAGAWRMDAGVVEKMTAQSVGAAHKLRELLFSVRAVESATCYEVVEEPTLFIVRYDYAHIYFTMLDWYNAYSAARVAGIKRRPNIVFVDGHSQSKVDEGWQTIFPSVRYAKSFPRPVCFRHAIFVPHTYSCPVKFANQQRIVSCSGAPAVSGSGANSGSSRPSAGFAGGFAPVPELGRVRRMHEFGEMVSRSFGIGLSSPPWWMDSWHHRNEGLPVPSASGRGEDGSEPTAGTGGGRADAFESRSPSGAARALQDPLAAFPGKRRLLAEERGSVEQVESAGSAGGSGIAPGVRLQGRRQLAGLSTLKGLFLGAKRRGPAGSASVKAKDTPPAVRVPAGSVDEASGNQGGAGSSSSSGGGSDSLRSLRQSRALRVLFLRRENYVAHPRHSGKVLVRLANEDELLRALQKWALTHLAYDALAAEEVATRGTFQLGVSGATAPHKWTAGRSGPAAAGGVGGAAEQHDATVREESGGAAGAGSAGGGRRVYVINGTMAHWSMREQMEAAYSADVIVGAHGAGLAYVAFARPGTAVVELGCGSYRHGPTPYEHISKLRGFPYTKVTLVGTRVPVGEVVRVLNGAVRDFYGDDDDDNKEEEEEAEGQGGGQGGGWAQRQEDVVEIIAPLEGGGAQDGVNPEFGFGGALAGLPHRVIGGQGQGQAEDEGQEAGVSWARGDVRSRVDQLREHHFFESMVAHHPALRNCSCGRWEALAAAAAAAEPGWQRAALNPGEGGATALPLTFNVSPALALQAEAKGGDDAHTGGEEGQDEQATEEGQDEQATEVEVQEEAEQATQGEGQDEETMLAEDEGDAPQVEAGGEEEAQDEQQQQQQQQAAGIEYGEVRTVEVAADEQSKGQSARRQAGTGGHDSLASGSAGSSLAGSGDRGGDLRDSGASLPRGAVALRGNSWQQGAGRFPQALVHRLPRGSTRRLQRRRLRRRLLAATGNVEPDSSETRMLKWLVERMPGHTVVTVPLSALQQPLNGQDPKGGSSGGGGSDAQQQQQQQASGGGGPSGRSDSGSSDGGGLFPPCTGDGPCTICLCRD